MTLACQTEQLFSYGTVSKNNKVQGNLIGTKANGTEALPNGSDGVRIEESPVNIVGGLTADPGTGLGNVISGNSKRGIFIFGDASTENQVLGNLIGTDKAGQNKRGNSSSGVYINSGARNIIGGAAAGSRNIISGNGLNGVEIGDITSSDENKVLGNFIGTNVDGSAAIANGTGGVVINRGNNNKIGEPTATPGTGPGNVISGNGDNAAVPEGNGVHIRNGDGNEIKGNLIDTNKDGTDKLALQRGFGNGR